MRVRVKSDNGHSAQPYNYATIYKVGTDTVQSQSDDRYLKVIVCARNVVPPGVEVGGRSSKATCWVCKKPKILS
jgi:hypothetical protein